MADEVVTGPVETPEGETVVIHRRSWPLRILKWIALTLLGIVLLLALVLFGLDTAPGRRFVADQIDGLKFASGMQIRIGRIEGSIYGQMVLEDLSIRDPKGEFLYSPEVRVDWRPFAYLNKHVDVRTAFAQQMILRRNPAFNVTPPSPPNTPLLPDLDIDIGHLHVDRFIAAPPVSGATRVASLDGAAHIASGRAQIRFNGATIAGADRGGGDKIALTLDAVPDQDKLNFNLQLDAPQKGVITALAGLKQPLTVRAAGNGAWSGWKGRIDTDLGGAPLTRLQLLGTNGTITMRGPTYVSRLVNGATASLLGPQTDVALSAVLGNRRAKVTGTISSDAFTLAPDGTVDLSDNSFKDFKLAFVLLKPSAIAPKLSGAGIQFLGTLNGAFATPKVDYVISADRIVMNDMGLEHLSAHGAATVDAQHILIPVAAHVARITGLDAVAGGQLANVSLNGDIAIKGSKILSDNMRIRSDRIDAKLILLADMAKGLYTGAVNGKIDNYRIESLGVFDIQTDAKLRAVGASGFAMTGKVRVRSTKLFNSGVASFLGGNAVASTDVGYGTDGVVRFANLRLVAPLLRVTSGSGTYSTKGQIALKANAISTQYGKIGVRVAGTVSAPHAFVTAEHPGLGIGLANLDAEVIGSNGGYRLKAKAGTDYGPLTANVLLQTKGRLSVQIDSANLGGIAFAGNLQQTAAGPFSGILTAKGNGLGGLVRLDAQGKYQEALVNIRANATTMPGTTHISIGSAIIDARIVLYDKPYIVADAQLSDTTYQSYYLDAARVIVDYRNGSGHAKAVIEGSTGLPFRLAANVDLKPDMWRAMLDGRTRGVDFKTDTPARVIPRKNGSYELLPTRVDVGTGHVDLAGSYGAGIKLQSRMEGLDLNLINAFMPGYGIGGSATGVLDFSQESADAFPHADARLTISHFTRTTAATVSTPVDVNLVGRLMPDGAQAGAVLRQQGAVIGRLQVSLRPLGPGAGTWTSRMMAAPLGGGIRFNGPSDTLASFAGLVGQKVSGPIGVAADFSCKVDAPCLTGVIRANDLTYENQAYGTRLSHLALDGAFTGDRFTVKSMNANAGAGTIKASGYVSLAAASGYPMDLTVTLDRAQLAKSEAVSAEATGDLHLTKTATEPALLSGTLKLPETRYEIVRQGAADIPTLTGVRFKPPLGPHRITGDEPAPQASASFLGSLRLDLAVVAPEKLYVSGMGLDSEWSMHLKVQGTASAPVLSGQVELVRGNLDFAGKSFDLTTGLIVFNGGQTIDPTLNIVASQDIDDITVTVNVGGEAFNPQITFTSSPSLPQDEVVSRILFGSSVENLTALQAVQLASSLNSLRGSGGGLNPLGKLRSATGISRLRILSPDATTGRGTALSAGQYITNNVYVELITDAKGFTATQVEVSFTKWLSALGQAGGSGLTNLSVRIKKNY